MFNPCLMLVHSIYSFLVLQEYFLFKDSEILAKIKE